MPVNETSRNWLALRKLMGNPHCGEMAGQVWTSFFRAMLRHSASPMTTRSVPGSGWNRRLERGIRTSAYQPCSSREVSASQNVFQLKFGSPVPSLGKTASVRSPAGDVPKTSAVSLSLNGSRSMTHQSLLNAPTSRCSDGDRMPSGSESYARHEK